MEESEVDGRSEGEVGNSSLLLRTSVPVSEDSSKSEDTTSSSVVVISSGVCESSDVARTSLEGRHFTRFS